MTTSFTRTEVIHNGENLGVIMNGTMHEWCRRCGGSGQYSYNPQDGTRCFGCNGSGLGKATTEADAIRRADNRRKAANARARAAQHAAEIDAQRAELWQRANADLFAKMAELGQREGEDLLFDLWSKAKNTPPTPKQQELAASIVRRIEEADTRKAAAQELGHYPAKEGEKITVDVEIIFTKFIEGSFNGRPTYSTLVIMKTAEGHTLKTFTSGVFGDVEKGQHVTIKATVKAHEEYNGTPSTTLTRVKAI